MSRYPDVHPDDMDPNTGRPYGFATADEVLECAESADHSEPED